MTMLHLSGSSFLMPGNLAWRPLAEYGEVQVAPHGQWLQTLMNQGADAAAGTHIIIWLWEDLVPARTLPYSPAWRCAAPSSVWSEMSAARSPYWANPSSASGGSTRICRPAIRAGRCGR